MLPSSSTETPVLLIVFNRLNPTKRVFETIRAARPKYLFISADGPRTNRVGELEKCNEVREYLRNSVDWPCQVEYRYLTDNLGCRDAVSTAISWFFSKVDRGIILEDDCVPNSVFYEFCDAMLTYYLEDERVMMVGGCNTHSEHKFGDGSYFFWRYNSTWGWATWRRAWEKFDIDLNNLALLQEMKLLEYAFPDTEERGDWQRQFRQVKYEAFDTWDWQWKYSMFVNNGLCILPNFNMIENIGFGEDATHTFGAGIAEFRFDEFSMDSLKHPSFVVPCIEAERYSHLKFSTATQKEVTTTGLLGRSIGVLLETVRKVARHLRSVFRGSFR